LALAARLKKFFAGAYAPVLRASRAMPAGGARLRLAGAARSHALRACSI